MSFSLVCIPDDKAADLASKTSGPLTAATTAVTATATATPTKSVSIPMAQDTKMYKVDEVYGDGKLVPELQTKMYKMDNVYD
jgi:hypothetical protein